MPIIGLPDFEPGVLTAAQLNAYKTVVEAKFTGNVTADDMSWPFAVGGDLDMGHINLILGLPKFWGVFSLAHRYGHIPVQSVFDEVERLGGGTVLLPGNTSQTSAGRTETVNGGTIKLGNSVRLLGEGWSSKIGNLSAEDKSNVTVENIELVTSTGHIAMTRCTDVTLRNVNFNNMYVSLTDCTNVVLDNCRFDDSSADYHVYLLGCRNVTIANSYMENWAEYGICASATASHPAQGLRIYDNQMLVSAAYTGTTYASVYVTGDGATDYDDITVNGNQIIGGDATSVVGIGVTNITVDGNLIVNSVSDEMPSVMVITNTLTFRRNNTPDTGVRVRDNVIDTVGLAIAVGMSQSWADIASNLRSSVYGLQVVGNVFVTSDAGCLFNAATATMQRGMELVAFGNVCDTVSQGMSISGLGASTTKQVDAILVGNYLDPSAASTGGFETHTGSGDSRGAILGISAFSWMTFCYNHSLGTTQSDTPGSGDFATTLSTQIKLASNTV